MYVKIIKIKVYKLLNNNNYPFNIIYDKESIMRQYETYRCNKCGNEVEVQNVGGELHVVQKQWR